MLAFQREPDPRDEVITCDKCHKVLNAPLKTTSENEPFCEHCGHTLGHCIQPSVWSCEGCGEVILHHGGDDRPRCGDCKSVMACFSAQPSKVHGCGIGNKDLDLGYNLLIDAQELDLELGTDILQDMTGEQK